MNVPSSPYLWSAIEAGQATRGQTRGRWQATGLSTDTRALQPGEMFIALKSRDFPDLRGQAESDGHKYIRTALEKNAGAVIVEDVPDDLRHDLRVLQVPATRQALLDLGAAARKRTGAVVVGVTGSVGKTSTREMLGLTFSAFGPTHTSKENFNNIIGVPLTLANLPREADFAVIEMGMDRAGEMTALAQLAQPHIAIITTVAGVHLANFPDGIDGVARAKAEIFAGLQAGGAAIINRDDATYTIVHDCARAADVNHIYTFGEHADADARLIECVEARNGCRARAQIMDTEVSFFIPAGRHQVMNALAVLLAVKAAGLNIVQAAEKFAEFAPIRGRGQEEKIDIGDPENPVILIDESYNASPPAMNAAFRVLALIDPGRGGRRIAILGDMLELGSDAPRLHADLALPLRAANIDLVYTCGTLMKHLHDALPANARGAHRNNSAELAQIVPDVLVPGDVVMVKGSHSSRMDLVVEALRALPARKKGSAADQKDHRHAL